MSSYPHAPTDATWWHRIAKATYKDYVEKKKRDGEKPLAEDDWEALVKGKGDGEHKTERAKPRRAPTPDMEDLTKDDTGPVGDVVQAIKEKKSPTREQVQEALALVQKRIDSFGDDSDVSRKEQKTTKDLQAWLKDFLGMDEEEKNKLDIRAPALTDSRSRGQDNSVSLSESLAESLGEYAQAMSKEEDKANARLKARKKIYERDRAAVIDRLEKHGLGEADLSDIQTHASELRKKYESDKKRDPKTKEPDYHAEWEKENPKSKIPKKDYEAAIGLPDKEPQEQKKTKTPTEIKRDFLKNVKDPDDKAAFEDMDIEEFMAAFNSLMKGKKGSLRRQVVRLAYVRPDLRHILLSALGEP